MANTEMVRDLTEALSELLTAYNKKSYIIEALRSKIDTINEDLDNFIPIVSQSIEIETDQKLKFLATKADVLDCLNMLEKL
jgi:hypothetical protein